jgi:hypothetical protein
MEKELELINTTWNLTAAEDGFPLGKPVEVISGETCIAMEYRTTRKSTETVVEVWGTVTCM